MNEQKVILGELEDGLYAEVARRDLEAAGIRANVIKDNSNLFILFSEQDKAVRLVIPVTQIEKAKQIMTK